MLESCREFKCNKCNHTFKVEADVEQHYMISKPPKYVRQISYLVPHELSNCLLYVPNLYHGVYLLCVFLMINYDFRCPAPEFCPSTKFTKMESQPTKGHYYRDYQEIKVQEQIQKLEIGTIPRSICVILEDDLVDLCKAGDDVTVV